LQAAIPMRASPMPASRIERLISGASLGEFPLPWYSESRGNDA
jgi:hypothetical protein